MAKRVLITGAAGFVGYHLAKRLQGAGYELTLVDNFALGQHDEEFRALTKERGVVFLQCDLTQARAWEKLGFDFDDVYHLAAINSTKLFYEIPAEILRSALLLNVHALEWFKKNKKGSKILFTSSNEAYAGALEAFGILPLPTLENVPLVIADPRNPRWSYAGTKLIGELLFNSYAKQYGLRTVVVRPHNFYGPRSGHHVIPDVLGRIERREDPFALYGADETRSFCYIDDAVEAMQAVMESSKTDGETYHIGTSVETNIGELVEVLFERAGWRPNVIERKPGPTGSVKRRVPDVSKIKRDTGWEAVTALRDGLKKTIAWYEKNPGK